MRGHSKELGDHSGHSKTSTREGGDGRDLPPINCQDCTGPLIYSNGAYRALGIVPGLLVKLDILIWSAGRCLLPLPWSPWVLGSWGHWESWVQRVHIENQWKINCVSLPGATLGWVSPRFFLPPFLDPTYVWGRLDLIYEMWLLLVRCQYMDDRDCLSNP